MVIDAAIRTVREQITDRLRDDILSGRIAEGERLQEAKLAERFGVSRGPIREVLAQLRAAGVRAITDLRNEKISYKIREHSLQKLPYQVVLGDKEMQAHQVAVRTRAGEDLGAMPLETFVTRLQSETAARR